MAGKGALLGLAVAGGVAVVVATRSKKTKKKPKKPGPVSHDAIVVTTWVPPEEPEDEPTGGGREGVPCPDAVTGKGNHGVWDAEGNCVVYWEAGVTDEALRVLLREEFDRRGRPKEACAGSKLVPHKDAYESNAEMASIVGAVLTKYYNQPAGAFPPTEVGPTDDTEASPQWIAMTWSLTWTLAQEELCDFVPIT